MQPVMKRQLMTWASYLGVAVIVLMTFAIMLRPNEPDIVINTEIQEKEDAMVARMEEKLSENEPKSQTVDEPWKDVSVLCLVTTNAAFRKRAIAANATWGKRCNQLVIMSHNGNITQNIIPIYKPNKEKEGNPNAVSIMMALDYVRRNHGNDYDWFVHVDDQTYVVIENLRYFLHRIKSQEEVFFMQETVKRPTMGGSPPPTGFVLNQKAMTAFGKFDFKRLCAPIGVKTTAAIQRCMRLLKVDKENEVEGVGRGHYYGFDLGWSLRGENYNVWPPKLNVSIQADVEYPIFYNGIQDRKFYTLEFLLYQARLWGERPNDSGEAT